MRQLLFAAFFLYQFTSIAQSVSKKPLEIGETLSFNSKYLKEKRVLNVYLPESYSSSANETYPVIYVLDGSIDEDFLHMAGLIQFQSYPWINKVPEAIVVGIANVDRKRDFTDESSQAADKKELPTSGGSSAFISFLDDEVIPLIEKSYRTNDSSTIVGQSLGGLLITEILYRHSNMFDNYLIVSPSLWWDDERWLLSEPAYINNSKSVYIAVGKEGEVMERVAQSLYEKLQLMIGKDHSIHFRYFDNLDHGDTLHLAAYHGLEEIFKFRRM
ncbi:alpha/beta hydrolase [Nonlabens marinus]|uniref:Putative esterase n=1 Tax=Nonlabens marinus S1-08 TaxID=1454201 RepID=W8VU07_9FLAO|nr:alpha/beta hydrolase-fold protein [Nonlabens marinus]BAO54168.1 putative esterase [Nonlabens marinus S1-08]